MSDPRVDLLAKHIASVLVTLIDIARDGEGPKVNPYPTLVEEMAAAPAQEEPAKRKGRPPKADAVTTETSAADAKPASESGTATADGSGDTGRSTGPTPSTSKPSTEAAPDTLAIAQELTIKLVQTKGRDAAVGALGDFNVAKASALAADQIGAYCEAVRELLAG